MNDPGAIPAFRIPDRHVTTAPSAQNAIDIFRGAWTSGVPGLETGGTIPLFADERMRWFLDRVDLVGKSVLELGPFEGGHSYMMHQAGAASILAIEASWTAYLKTLVIKENLGLARLRLMLGEIETWLTRQSDAFDVIVASGVLYHFTKPLRALYDMCLSADTICLWTHYIDHVACPPGDPRNAPFTGEIVRDNVRGFEADGRVRSYEGTEAKASFCGGVGSTSVWLEKAAIITALERWGFHVEVGLEEPGHEHGPAAAFFARRRVPREAPDV